MRQLWQSKRFYFGRMQTTVPGGKFAGMDGCEGCEETDLLKGFEEFTDGTGMCSFDGACLENDLGGGGRFIC